MESPEHERRSVVQYMAGQASDETVEHAEKVASERVFDTVYDVWDVHTDKERWWVITGMTNLYSQSEFKSMDYALSFHIGVTTRVWARESRKAPDTPEPRYIKMRRLWEQAAEAQNEADEAEEFQAVGMRCRETLVSLVQAMASDELVPPGEEAPKAADFIHWSELIANAVAGGSHDARLRKYLKSVAKETWEYVSWLTHAKNAVRADGDIAVDIVSHLINLFEQAILRKERGAPERCPSCGSYRLSWDTDYDLDEGLIYRINLCEACDWNEPYEPEPLWAPEVVEDEDE